MTISEFTNKYTPLTLIVGNGRGQYFAKCHVCFGSSPVCDEYDDLKVLAKAKAAGWTMVPVAGQPMRLFCTTPKCQAQA